MKTEPKKRCPHCNAKMVEYRHSLNKSMVSALMTLAKRYKPTALQELPLSKTQFTNFQKLRYWGLVERTKEEGKWDVTYYGMRFLQGEVQTCKRVWTYRGEFKKSEGESVWFHDLSDEPYLKREDYAREAQRVLI